MARINDFRCDRCTLSIGDMPLPFVIYTASGVVGASREVFLTPGTLAPEVEALNLLPESRVEYCVTCWVQTHLVHPEEVRRLLDLAVAEHRALGAMRTVEEVEYKRERILALALREYTAQVLAAARELNLVPAEEGGD